MYPKSIKTGPRKRSCASSRVPFPMTRRPSSVAYMPPRIGIAHSNRSPFATVLFRSTSAARNDQVPVPFFSQPLRRPLGGRSGAALPDVLATTAVDLGRGPFEAVSFGLSKILQVVPKVFTAIPLERRAASRSSAAAFRLACLLLALSLCWQTKRIAFERSLGCLQHHFGSCLGQKDAPKARVAGRLGRSGRGFFTRSSASPGLPHLSSLVGLVPAARQR